VPIECLGQRLKLRQVQRVAAPFRSRQEKDLLLDVALFTRMKK
jgi:hypothetical protein